VDHVLGSHDQFHRASDWNVQLVDFALALRVLRLPHPLLADDEDLHRARGRPVHIEENLGAPGEHHHRDAKRNERPQQLERQRTVNRGADLAVVAAAVLDRESNDQPGDQEREERRYRHHEEIDGVDLRGLRRRLLRKERKAVDHR
jgi:hypothetical protein